jgi:hypothetical protein
MKTLTPVLRKPSVLSVFTACFAWGQTANSASFDLDVSANAANVIHHPSFALPDKVIGPGHIGSITGTSVGPVRWNLLLYLGSDYV